MSQKKVLPLHRFTEAKASDTDDSDLQNVENEAHQSCHFSPATVVGDAVGVSEKHWYAAFVSTNTEKACRDRLIHQGHEAWVASQQELRVWRNGRRSKVERVVIPLIVFVRATEQERRQIVNYPYIHRFMTDKARAVNDFGVHPVATIPDCQIESLKFILYQSDSPVSFLSHPLKTGDSVRVVRGQLQGLEGQVTRNHDGHNYVVVNIGVLGCAMVRISLTDVEKV